MSELITWRQIKLSLEQNTTGKLLHTVLASVQVDSSFLEKEGTLRLYVPSSFHKNILQKHSNQIKSLFKNPVSILIKKPSALLDKKAKKKVFLPKEKINQQKTFLDNWTFSSFIEGPQNSFALALAKNITSNLSYNKMNPLFLYSRSGMGKTHLLHAIGNALQNKNISALYISAERFLNDFIIHIRKNNMNSFRQKYRKNISVLLMDDVQILGRGESIQEEFFHTFETLKQKGTQVVLACDQRPQDIKGLKTRLQTRFEGGVMAEIGTPDKNTKKAIIKYKAIKKNLVLNEQLIDFFTELCSFSIRETEGHLNTLKMFCELNNVSPCLSLAKKIFSDNLNADQSFNSQFSLPKQINKTDSISQKLSTIKALKKEVAKMFGVSTLDLISKSRIKNHVLARQLAIYIARKELGLSLLEIGNFFGNRNHSTVLSSIKKIQGQQQTNIEIFNKIRDLKNLIHKKTKN